MELKMITPSLAILLMAAFVGVRSMDVLEETPIEQEPFSQSDILRNEIKFLPEDDPTGESREARQRRRRPQQEAGETCKGENNDLDGTCMNKRLCLEGGGKEMGGACSNRGFVCCVMTKTCTESTRRNNTRFQNSQFPKADTGNGACILTIERINNNICQMRFDFKTFELAQPDEDGDCKKEFVTVTGGDSSPMKYCGQNTGSHIYVGTDPTGGAVKLVVDRIAGSQHERRFDILVTQIECNSNFKAPDGCLQYYTETSGTVNSFNFQPEIEEIVRRDGIKEIQKTRQLKDMRYSVCIKAAPGYCGITYSKNTIYGGRHSFSMTSNVRGLSENLLGNPAASSTADRCESDYVVIPGGRTDVGVSIDRFCGAGFPNYVYTALKPFVLFVVNNEDEEGDEYNRGFSLDYRQNICQSPFS